MAQNRRVTMDGPFVNEAPHAHICRFTGRAVRLLLAAALLGGCSLEVSSARPHFGDCTRMFSIDAGGDWSCGGDPYLSGCVALEQRTCPLVAHYQCDGYTAVADVQKMTITIDAGGCVNVHRVDMLETER